MKRTRTLAFLMIAASMFVAPDARACTCAYQSLAHQYILADFVYAGTVLEIDTVGQQLEVRMDTREVFKGALPFEIVLRTHVSTATCGYTFTRVGEEFLVFAYGPNEHHDFPTTNLCTRTRPLSEAVADLEVLRRGPERSPYLPIAPGNTWTYGYPPSSHTDPVTARVTEVAPLEDRTYFGVSGLPIPADTLFQDRFGNIWWQRGGRETMLIDFELPEGYAYAVQTDSAYFIVTAEHDVTAHLQVGTFERCMRFMLESPSTDRTWAFTFAPDVGLVLATSSTGAWYELLSGNVSGRVVSSANPEHPEGPGLTASVHPNPVVDDAILTLQVASRNQIRVTVHDVLGREVAQLGDASMGPGAVELRWDASSHPAGVYFIRVQDGMRAEVMSVVRQ